MVRPPNKPTDIFKHIDMTGGRDACWPFKGKLNSEGRPYFTAGGKKQLAYRLVYELVIGDDIEGFMLCHSCDNPVCCNPYHVTKGDQQSNMDEMKERQRHGLPHHTVRAIRKLGDAGINHRDIADRFGIGRSTVSEIVERKNYQHVLDEETK